MGMSSNQKGVTQMVKFMILETASGKSAGTSGQNGLRSARQRHPLGPLAIVLLWLLPLAGCGGGATHSLTPTSQPTTIAFNSRRAVDGSAAANTNGTQNIWVMKSDGTGATPLTKLTASQADVVAAAWSPDGSKIAFESLRALDGSDAGNTNNTRNIWAMKSDGTGATPLTKLTANGALSFFSVWSPDGGKIAFLSERALDGSDAENTNSTENIWVIKADGSGAAPLTKLTAFNARTGSPVWSPDRSKIVFDSQRALAGSDAANINSVSNIWVMIPNSSSATPLTRLTVLNADSFDPVWSLDGSKIAFDSQRALDGSAAANTNSVSNIWVMSPDGSAAVPLTKLTALNSHSFSPEWKPGFPALLSPRRYR